MNDKISLNIDAQNISVDLNTGIIRVTVIGPTSEETASKTVEEAKKILRTLKEHSLKGRVLVDLNKAEPPSSNTRKKLLSLNLLDNLYKVALFGLHPVANVIANFIISFHTDKNIKYFSNEQDALKWLME